MRDNQTLSAKLMAVNPSSVDAPKEGWLGEQITDFVFRTIGTITFPRQIEWHLMLKWLRPQIGERILDVACGEGQLTLKIGLKGCTVYGIDSSTSEIGRARRLAERQRIDSTFDVGDAQQLPYPDESFDKIVCSSSLEHFKNAVRALREMHRVLKRNGTLVVTVDSFTYAIDPAWKSRHKKWFYVENYYDKGTLRARFAESGFEMVRSNYLLHSRAATLFFKNHLAIHSMALHKYPSFFLTSANSVIAYPIVLILDQLSNENNGGYTLLAEGKKIPSRS